MESRITGHRWGNLVRALLLSLAFHALVLSLQFGDAISGLPWFSLPGLSKPDSIPKLNALLIQQKVVTQPPPVRRARPVASRSEKPPAVTRSSHPPLMDPPPQAITASVAAPAARVQDALAERSVEEVVAAAPKAVSPPASVDVLSTDKESTWHQPVGLPEREAGTQDKQDIIAPTREMPVDEEKAVAEQARIDQENAALEAAEREKELALERMQAEEQARLDAMKAQAAAVARAQEAEADRLAEEKAAQEAAEKMRAEQQRRAEEQALERARAEERASQEAMRAQEAVAARAKEQAALARKQEAERLAAESAARAAAEKPLAEPPARFPDALAGTFDGGRESGNGSKGLKGSELARRAIDAIKGGQVGLPGIDSAPVARPRRGSILGSKPGDIQLAFYGEGWRQKVERIGSLNYPTLSRNLTYDPLVVTVSINSDGTLAGVRIVKSSGHKHLDEAVLRIVTMSAPFAEFPPAMKRLFDVVDITRTWIFLDYRPSIANQ